MAKTLICSAWTKETKVLEEKLDDSYRIVALGVGYLDAALNLERILAKDEEVENIIFIGTAGAYSKTIEIGTLVEVTRVALLNFGTVDQKAYVPKAYDEYHCFPSFDKKIKKASCLSNLEITKDTKVSKRVMDHFQSRDLVENMELYGVAKIANHYKKPLSSLLVVTNNTNVDAHDDWKENEAVLSTKLGEALLTHFGIDFEPTQIPVKDTDSSYTL